MNFEKPAMFRGIIDLAFAFALLSDRTGAANGEL
jgi:hypothetical protein